MVRSWWAAAVGGLMYGFSPYMLSQSLGHAMLTPAFYPALAVVFADEVLVRQRRRPAVVGVLLGIATAVQLMTSQEILGMTVIMGVPALATLAVIHRTEVRERLGYVLRVAAPALLSFLVLAAYPLYVLFLGPQRVRGPLWYLNYYVATVERFVVPSGIQLIGFGARAQLGDSSVYIGIPLLLLAAAAVVRLRRRTVVVVAAVTLACAMVLSLGGYLSVTDGHPTQLELPWTVINHTPFLNNILPIRVMLFGYLALALLVAVFLDSVPAFFESGAAGGLSTTGSVLMTPTSTYASSVWQAVAGIGFHSATGPVFTPAPGGWRWDTDLGALGARLGVVGKPGNPDPDQLSNADFQACVAELRALDVRSVVVGPERDQAEVAQLFTELLGRPGQAVGGVIVWYRVDLGA